MGITAESAWTSAVRSVSSGSMGADIGTSATFDIAAVHSAIVAASTSGAKVRVMGRKYARTATF